MGALDVSGPVDGAELQDPVRDLFLTPRIAMQADDSVEDARDRERRAGALAPRSIMTRTAAATFWGRAVDTAAASAATTTAATETPLAASARPVNAAATGTTATAIGGGITRAAASTSAPTTGGRRQCQWTRPRRA